jgi:hypothetical protein
MSEPFLERLSRFTPDAAGLNRDALLYAAGRASARTNRAWIILTAALVVTQPLSLVLLRPRPAAPGMNLAIPTASRLSPLTAQERSLPDSSDSRSLWSVRHRLLDSEPADDPVPPGAATFVENGPLLRAFTPLPPSLLN